MSESVKLFQQKTLHIARKLEQFLGVPLPPKRVAKPLDMLIATVLSQNTNDKNSHRAYLQLHKKYPSWSAVLVASARGIASAIRVGGMANQKSVCIKSILTTISERFGSLDLRFLRTKTDDEIFEILLSLDGVGSKTAACVLLFSLGRNIFPVDTHIHRICGRLGISPHCTTPEKTFEWMKRIIPAGKAYSFHTNLIRFGRRVCRSARPLCGACPLYDECRFAEKKKFRNSSPELRARREHNFMLLDHI